MGNRYLSEYLRAIERELATGVAAEHAYRPALKSLLESVEDELTAVNDRKTEVHLAVGHQSLFGALPMPNVKGKLAA
jgi:hypothetical protein